MKTNICIVICAVSLMVSGCSGKPEESIFDFSAVKSFRDIPGITAEEISGVEALQKEYDSFIYGMPPSTEAFIDENGNPNGYAALFCEWLTSLFGIRFDLNILEWTELSEKVNLGEVDFSVHFVSGNEAPDNFYAYDNLIHEEYFPLTYSPVSMITANPPLSIIINILNKALRIPVSAEVRRCSI